MLLLAFNDMARVRTPTYKVAQANAQTDNGDHKRIEFHPDFLYEHKHWSTRLIIVSNDGTHFRVPMKLLADHSTVFAGALSIPSTAYTALQPVPLAFASISALLYILTLLRGWEAADHSNMCSQSVTSKVIFAASRIVLVLDMPLVGKMILASQRLDVYTRYAIVLMLESLEISDCTKKPVYLSATTTDLSFSQQPHGQFRRAHDLLLESNSSASVRLAVFHARRKTALIVLRQWWTTGEPLGRVLRSDRPPTIVHKLDCKKMNHDDNRFRQTLTRITPMALAGLAAAKTTGQRTKNVIAVVAAEAGECRGCLARLEAVYMPALRVFNASFPASPT
jgi:hypothetical protein